MINARRRLLAVSAVALIAVPCAAVTASLPMGQSEDASAEVMFGRAEDQRSDGRLDEAAETLQRLVRDHPSTAYPESEWRAAARVRLAEMALGRGEVAAAAAAFARVLDEESESDWVGRARLGLGEALLSSGHWHDAIDVFRTISIDARNHPRDVVDVARRRQTLVHRMVLRPDLGQRPWTSARLLSTHGIRLDDPIGVAAGDDGSVVVVDEGIPLVAVFVAGDDTPARQEYRDHRRPWWGPDGRAYLLTRRSGVDVFGGARLGFLAPLGDGTARPLKNAMAGQQSSTGEWFLLDDDPRRVLRFTPDGLFDAVVPVEGNAEIVDVAVDRAGRVHLLDRRGKSVLRVDSAGRPLGSIRNGTWRRPEALEVDALGNVFVLDRDARTLDVFDAEGVPVTRLGPTLPGGIELGSPRDVAVDGSGRVYIADRDLSAIVVLE